MVGGDMARVTSKYSFPVFSISITPYWVHFICTFPMYLTMCIQPPFVLCANQISLTSAINQEVARTFSRFLNKSLKLSRTGTQHLWGSHCWASKPFHACLTNLISYIF